MWIERTPRFNDDDSPFSWLKRLGIDGMEELYKKYQGDIDKEILELRKEGNTHPIGGIYFTLIYMLKYTQETNRELIEKTINEIRRKYLGEQIANSISALLDKTIIDT